MNNQTKIGKQFLRLTLGLLMIGTTAAYAADASVFGLTFGQPLPIMPECEREPSGIGYSLIPRTTCFRKSVSPTHDIDIDFPDAQAPKIVRGYKIDCLLVQGTLEGISFQTRGINNQDFVLTQLITKYGNPSSIERPIVKNWMGAQFNRVEAIWRLPNLHVVFIGASGTLDSGIVSIKTTKGAADAELRMKPFNHDPRPL